MRRRSEPLLGIARRAGVLAALMSVARPGLAASPADEPQQPEAQRPARVLFERAEVKFSVGKFAEAALDYQQAYESEPLPGLLFNIGQCYRNMGEYERAAFMYRRYVVLE